MCSPMSAIPMATAAMSSAYHSYMSFMSSGAINPTAVIDTKADNERQLREDLREGLRRTQQAQYQIMECIRKPAVFFLWFTAVCIIILIAMVFLKQGGLQWFF